jgi:hypothetical protein
MARPASGDDVPHRAITQSTMPAHTGKEHSMDSLVNPQGNGIGDRTS